MRKRGESAGISSHFELLTHWKMGLYTKGTVNLFFTVIPKVALLDRKTRERLEIKGRQVYAERGDSYGADFL